MAALLEVGDRAADRGAGARRARWTRWPQEIRLMLDEGVVAEAQDIDLA